MAKTQFANGSVILPAWINSIFGSGGAGGHVHDGADDDGHAAKIDLYDHVDISVNSLTMTVTSSYFTSQQTGTLIWAQAGRLVFMFLPQILGVSNSADLVAALSGSPSLPTPYQTNQYLGCSLEDDNALVPGLVKIGAAQFDFYCLPAASDGNKSAWGSNFASSNNKGILDQTLCYLCA